MAKVRDDRAIETEQATEEARGISRRALLQGSVAAASLAAACGGDDDTGDGTDDLGEGGAGGSGGAGGGAGTATCSSSEYEGAQGPATLFEHGVASGDPLADAVILWTRVSASGSDDVDVTWDVSLDPEFDSCTTNGSATASAGSDFTVKVDATGLEAGTTYYYRFHALGRTSPVGRTRTAPSGTVDRLRFGVVSCASLAHGYFHVYREVSRLADLDVVIHLGDYIYEYGSGQYGDVRDYEPAHEILSLDDYRTRHSQYKRDADLQECHRQHPVIAVWDDHETADNSWSDGASNHQADEGSWADRKAAALQAYSEWMPIRDQAGGKIWRELKYGSLVDLIMLDTRIWGRSTACPLALPGEPCESRLAGEPVPPDADRTILGDDQADWLEERLAGSEARWRLIGQQVMMMNLVLNETVLANPDDQWQGYKESRDRLLEYLRDSAIDNVVVLTGDIHSSWGSEIVLDLADPAYDPATGAGALAVEIVVPAVSSPGLPVPSTVIEDARPFNPHVRFFDTTRRGYVVLDITEERVQAAWFLYDDDITLTGSAESVLGAAWSVADGSAHLVEDAAAATARDDAPPLAPE